MSQYPNFDTTFLIELLAHNTKRLTDLITNNKFGKEYDDCKSAIQELQLEIEFRKKNIGTQHLPDNEVLPGVEDRIT